MTAPTKRLIARLSAITLQAAIGLFFVGSAVGKIIDIDTFEIYLYSFGFISLPVAMVGARVVIVIELLIGAALIGGIAPRRTTLAALLMVLMFTLFLVAAIWMGRDGNCHCMGSLVSLSAGWSLVKNAVLAVLLLILLRITLYQWHLRWFFVLPAALLIAGSIFAISMPDNWMYGSSNEQYDHQLLTSLAQKGEPLEESNILVGKHIVVMASDGCPYCHKALQKLHTIANRHNISEEQFIVIVPQQETSHRWDDDIPQLQGRRYSISVAQFLHLTYGQRPIIVLIEDGTAAATFHYRNIDEERIATFLNHE